MLDACLRIEIGPEPRVLPSFMNHFRTLHLRTKVLHFWIQTIFQVFHLDYPMRVYESNPISTVLLGTIRIQSKMIYFRMFRSCQKRRKWFQIFFGRISSGFIFNFVLSILTRDFLTVINFEVFPPTGTSMIANYCLRNVVPRSDAASNTDNESGVYLVAYRCLQRNLTVLTLKLMCLFESGVSFYLGTLQMPALWRPHWRKLAVSSRKHVLNEKKRPIIVQ
jgi:hypothetical protein